MFLMSKKNGYGIKYYEVFDQIQMPCLYLGYNTETHILAFLGKTSQSFSVNQPPWSLMSLTQATFLPALTSFSMSL